MLPELGKHVRAACQPPLIKIHTLRSTGYLAPPLPPPHAGRAAAAADEERREACHPHPPVRSTAQSLHCHATGRGPPLRRGPLAQRAGTPVGSLGRLSPPCRPLPAPSLLEPQVVSAARRPGCSATPPAEICGPEATAPRRRWRAAHLLRQCGRIRATRRRAFRSGVRRPCWPCIPPGGSQSLFRNKRAGNQRRR